MPVAGALIGAAGAIGGAVIGGSAAKKAAKTQAQAAGQANALQQYMYDTTRADQAPWRDIGGAAINQLKAFTTPGTDLTSWLQAQPGYQANLNQGLDAVQNSAAANGLLHSGGTLKALDRYGQDYASNQLTNIYNRLSNLAGMGQTANQSIAGVGQNYANQAGQNLLAAGQARAGGQLGAAGALNYGLQGLGQVAGNYFANNGYGSGLNLSPMSTQTVAGGYQPITPVNPSASDFRTIPSF